jgi:hypothetical protein
VDSDRPSHPKVCKVTLDVASEGEAQEGDAWSSVDRIAMFDAFKFVDMIAPRPLLMIVGTQAVTSWMMSEAFIAAREPKEVTSRPRCICSDDSAYRKM